MMAVAGRGSPQEFGRALRQARERAGVSLDDLVARTKISRRMLEGMEIGAFGRLPGETFARLFLRQYLELIGEPLEPWMTAFSSVWRRAEEQEASGATPALPVAAVGRAGKSWAWVVGVLLVVLALAGVAILQSQRELQEPAAEPTPTAVLALVTPPPVVTPPPPEASVVEPPCVLSMTTRDRPCWVAVRDEVGWRESRLLPAGSRWDIVELAGVVDLVIGDAAALELCFRGVTLPPPGRSGEVARVRLDPAEPRFAESQR